MKKKEENYVTRTVDNSYIDKELLVPEEILVAIVIVEFYGST